MGGTPVAIGPFNGGLNLNEDPRLIADNQLAECINFDIGRAGELMTRPGLKAARTSTNPIAGSTDFIRVINPLTLPSGFSRLFVRTVGVVTPRIYRSDNPEVSSGGWTILNTSTAGDVSVIVPGVDVINTTVPYAWFVPRGPNNAGGGFRQNLNDGVESAVSSIPRGSGAVVFKGRMFIYGPLTEGGTGTYRVYYSAAGDFATWPANNFFDVGPGDGETVTAIAVQGDSLIIFKRASTWALFFDTDPFLGTLRKVNNEIGCTGQYAVVAFQNELFVISKRSIYRLINLLFEDIGNNLNLDATRAYIDFNLYNDSISVIGSRIICAVSTGGGIIPYKYFVYHTEVEAWSEYDFDEYPERFVTVLDTQYSEHQFATKRNSPNLYHMHPFDTSTANYGDYPNDTSFHSMATKKYAYDSIAGFKRIFWWAVETVGNGREFDMFCIADDTRTSTAINRVSAATRSVAKAFVTNRFRTVQYSIVSRVSGIRMTLFSGQANIGVKAKVSAGVTD